MDCGREVAKAGGFRYHAGTTSRFGQPRGKVGGIPLDRMMARAPLQTLVIPHREGAAGGFEYAVFRRADFAGPVWQFIAGGAEPGETAERAARREMREEAGIPEDSPLIALQSTATVPAAEFAEAASWGPEVYVVPERAFAVRLPAGAAIALSAEHREYRWVGEGEAANLLRWDSNRTALWELARRLDRGDVGALVRPAGAAEPVARSPGDGPAIVLVEPQLGENIGTAARAMANFGLTDLRIVNPRDGWPSEQARRAASRADHVLDRARVFPSLPAATADLRFTYATTARPRETQKPVRGPQEAALAARRMMSGGAGVGILFGRERTGLTNDEVALADEIVTLPVDPVFASLNVAQAVLILAYEWRRSGLDAGRAGLPFDAGEGVPAAKAELVGLFEHLETSLDAAGFFRPVEKRPVMVLSLRAMLQRAGLTGQEVKTLRGVVAALEGRETRPRRPRGPRPAMPTEGRE